MMTKILIIPFILFSITGCLDPKTALDLVDTVTNIRPSKDWMGKLDQDEKQLKEKYGVEFKRTPAEGELQSYQVKVPRDVEIDKVLNDLEIFHDDLENFIRYYTDEFSNYSRRAEFTKKLAAAKKFLENYDKYFTSPSSSPY